MAGTTIALDRSMKTQLGKRPEPNKISFASDCFVITEYKTEYTVLRGPSFSGPLKTLDEKEASDYAKLTKREVIIGSTPIFTRVKWF
jgi:hypothetical protein